MDDGKHHPKDHKSPPPPSRSHVNKREQDAQHGDHKVVCVFVCHDSFLSSNER